MTSLTESYETVDYRQLKVTVHIGGSTLTNVHAVSYTFARGRVPTASITIPNPPSSSITAWTSGRRAAVRISLGFGAFEQRVFTGSVESVSRNERNCVIACVGKSRLLEMTYARTIPVTFDGDANDIVEDLLDEAGINDYDVDLPAWDIGSVQISEQTFQSFGDAVNHVSEVDGSVWHEMPNGQIRVGVYDPMPAASAFRTYYAAIPSAITESQPPAVTNASARPRLRAVDIQEYPREVRNRVTVRGAVVAENEIETTAFGPSPWIPNPPQYNDHIFSNDLIDTAAKAASVALRHYSLHNRLETVLSVRVSGDPQVFLCATVRLEDPNYSGANGLWFIESYTTNLSAGGFETSMELRGGGPAAGSTPQLDPFAAFSWSKAQQYAPSTLPGAPAGGGQAVVVTYDGRASQDFDGSIASWDWAGTADGGWTASGPIVSKTYDPAVDATDAVTLTVTDDDGNTDVLTLNVIIEPTASNPTGDDTLPGGAGDMGGAINIAQLFVAVDTHATASQDGGETWVDLSKASAGASGNFISVSAKMLADYSVAAVFGTDAGELVRTTDWCATGSVVATISGAPRIEDVWADTFAAGIWWAVTSNGKIYRSADDGATWALYKDFGDGFPLYAIATPGDNLLVFGGNSSTPGSLLRWDTGKTGSFTSIPIAGALATALTAAGANHHIIAAASREASDLGILFDSGLSPRLWYTSNIWGDGTGWTAATGLDVANGKALAPGFLGPGELLAIVADPTAFYATDGVTFAAAGDAPSQINHLFWEVGFLGAYVGAALDHVVKSNDFGDTWGEVRDLTALDVNAVGRKISFIAAPPEPAGADLYIVGDSIYERLQAGNVWVSKGATGTPSFNWLRYHGNGLMFHHADGGQEMWRSVDYGETWAQLTPPAGVEFISKHDMAPDGRLWVFCDDTGGSPDNGQVWYSDDLGDNWTLAAEFFENPDSGNGIDDIACHPTNPNLIAWNYRSSGALTNQVVVTTDRGATWFDLNGSVATTASAADSGGRIMWIGNRLVLAHDDEQSPKHAWVRISDDFGQSWSTALELTMTGTGKYVRLLGRCGPTGPLFLGLNRGSGTGADLIYRSLDGTTWEALDSPVTDATLLESFAYDILTDRLFVHWASGRIDYVQNPGGVTEANWLASFVTLPPADAGAFHIDSLAAL